MSQDSLGHDVRVKIASLGMLLDDAAKEIGCHSDSISQACKGRRINPSLRKKMRDWLDRQGPGILTVGCDSMTGRVYTMGVDEKTMNDLVRRLQIQKERFGFVDVQSLADAIPCPLSSVYTFLRGEFPGRKSFNLITGWLKEREDEEDVEALFEPAMVETPCEPVVVEAVPATDQELMNALKEMTLASYLYEPIEREALLFAVKHIEVLEKDLKDLAEAMQQASRLSHDVSEAIRRQSIQIKVVALGIDRALEGRACPSVAGSA